MLRYIAVVLLLFTGIFTTQAQQIAYSEPDRADSKSLDFDVLGKMNNHYLIFKKYRGDVYVSIYDADMKLIENSYLDFIPDKVINTDLVVYKDYFYLVYQYQKRSISYCMAARIDANGKIVGEPKQLDTTHINFYSENRIYNVISSEDKQSIMVFKINSRDKDNYKLTTLLFNKDFELFEKRLQFIPMPGRSDFLTEFNLDNDGNMAFIRASGSSDNDNIADITLLTKKKSDSTLIMHDLAVKDIYLDDVKLKVDNISHKYLLTSFYANQKRGNIEGLFCTIWDVQKNDLDVQKNIVFSDDVRKEAKDEGNMKFAFNDFFIQNILVKKDGGFVIASESAYSSSRGNTNSRWDYLYGSPFYRPGDFYYYNTPFYNSYYYPWWRSGSYGGYQINRYYADNIAIISVDSTASLEWTSVIHKSQYDDYTDNFLGYGTFNSGGEFHFLFNQLERRTLLLTDQSITPDGNVNRSPTLRNLSKDYEFMPRFSKQVSSYEIIVPCQYRNYICFAKIQF